MSSCCRNTALHCSWAVHAEAAGWDSCLCSVLKNDNELLGVKEPRPSKRGRGKNVVAPNRSMPCALAMPALPCRRPESVPKLGKDKLQSV